MRSSHAFSSSLLVYARAFLQFVMLAPVSSLCCLKRDTDIVRTFVGASVLVSEFACACYEKPITHHKCQ
jgi:hypothetical protein